MYFAKYIFDCLLNFIYKYIYYLLTGHNILFLSDILYLKKATRETANETIHTEFMPSIK